VDGKIVNLHEHFLKTKYPIDDILDTRYLYISNKLDICFKQSDYLAANNLNELVCHFYEHGFSCLEIIKWIKHSELIEPENKSDLAMKYHKIRREFRCEKMLMFFLLLSIKRFCVKNP
jgi:hypothetical protein